MVGVVPQHAWLTCMELLANAFWYQVGENVLAFMFGEN